MRRWFPAVLAIAFVAVWAVLALVPSTVVRGPGCQVREVTGIHCPGCGGTRAARHLARGEWRGAARDNLLIYPLAAMALWGVVAVAANRWGGRRWWTPDRVTFWMGVGFAVVALLFTILRNTAWGWFLRP